ncbi:MAG: alanyl-tRNA synthetase, partial [uncultured bacterium]
MSADEIRSKYLSFFQKAPRNHKIIPSAPLVPENDPTTLFNSAGMQPLIPYLLGQPHPLGKRLVNSQKSFRSQDIDEIGDNRHETFFEMLGNWSLGDYFKKEQLSWIWEFLTKELRLDPKKLYVSIFEGNESVPRDEESYKIWKDLGFSEDHIFYYDASKNWWSRSGTPENMTAGEPGGPDSEVFYDFGPSASLGQVHECHPNCQCGRFMEIGNSVFMEYQKAPDGKIVPL